MTVDNDEGGRERFKYERLEKNWRESWLRD